MRSARAVLVAALATVLIAQSTTPVQASSAPSLEAVPLGVPLSDVLLIGGTVAPGPGGKDTIWNASSGAPAHLNAIDPATGASLLSIPLPGAESSYAVTAAPDGAVYAASASNGALYRWRSGDTVEGLGQPLPGQTFILRITTDPQGNVYGGTFPGGRVFKYDVATGQTRDYGQLVAGQGYIRSIDYANGKIYAGAFPDGHLAELDPESGAITSIPVPPDLGPIEGKAAHDLNHRDGKLYVRFGTALPAALYVYDLATKTWSDKIPAAHGLDVSPAGPNGEIYLIQSSELKKYDPVTKTLTGTGQTFTGRIQNARSIGWADLGLPDWPGKTVVGTMWRGEMFRYNPQTGRKDFFATKVRREPIDVLSLTRGKTNAYAGGLLNGGVSVVNPATGAASFNRFAQTESLLEARDGKVWVGAYPEARVYSYDPSKPWSSPEYAPGPPGTPDNPKLELNLKEHAQQRAKALTEVAGQIAIGTIPEGDNLGGVLAIVDPATGEKQVTRHVVQDESIIALTARGTVVYGGASIAGGLPTTPPTRRYGAVFAYDAAAGKKLWETELTGATMVTSVTLGPDGLLWGVGGNTVFAVRPATGRVVRRYELGTARTGGDIVATERYLYAGLDEAKVFRIDPYLRGEPTVVLERKHKKLALRGKELLFSDGPQLYRITLPK